MTTARNQTFEPTVIGEYHCVARCVRRAFLCGFDRLTGKNFNHRKEWTNDRVRLLVEIFTVEALGKAILCNHNHLVLRNRPDLAQKLLPDEIAKRWLKLFPKRRHLNTKIALEPSDEEIKAITLNPEKIEKLRLRLSNISWFMRCLNEHIARRANREDDVKGRFWEGRFKCTKLDNEGAILACMVYVDLNEIRAKVATTPEESKFSSVYDRIIAKDAKEKLQTNPQDKNLQRLATLDSYLCPIEGSADRLGALSSVSLNQYLEIVDATGRMVVKGKAGFIPEHLAPILERLKINQEEWYSATTTFGKRFSRLAGPIDSLLIKAKSLGQCSLKGMAYAKKAFLPATS